MISLNKESLTTKQLNLIERAKKVSGSGNVKNPSNGLDVINELRGKSGEIKNDK